MVCFLLVLYIFKVNLILKMYKRWFKLFLYNIIYRVDRTFLKLYTRIQRPTTHTFVRYVRITQFIFNVYFIFYETETEHEITILIYTYTHIYEHVIHNASAYIPINIYMYKESIYDNKKTILLLCYLQ